MPPTSPIQALATHLLSTAAVAVASHSILQRYAAIQTLSPPPKVTENVDEKTEVEEIVKPALERVSWIHQVSWKRMSIIVVAAIALTATNMALIFASFRYVSQHQQNITWLLICAATGTMTIEQVIRVVFRPHVTIRLEREDGRVRTAFSRTDFIVRRRVQRAVALIITLAMLATAYYGHPEVLTIFPAIICYKTIVFWEAPTMRVDYLVSGMAGYMALCGLCIGGSMFFQSKTKSDTPTVYTLPSPAVAASMAVFTNAVPIMVPGYLAALSLRFDWSRTAETTVLPPGDSTDPYALLQPFPKPTYNAAMIALFISSCAIAVAAFYPPLGSDASGIAVSMPLTILLAAFAAWRTGQLKAWWKYNEMWVHIWPANSRWVKQD